MFALYLIAALVAALVALLYFYVQSKALWLWFTTTNEKGERMPGPFPFPWTALSVFANLRQLLLQHTQTYGKYVRLHMFGRLMIIVNEPEESKKILLKNQIFKRATNSLFDVEKLKDVIPLSGLGTPNETEWARQRKFLNPSFDQNSMRKLVPLFVKHIENLCKLWDGLITKESTATAKQQQQDQVNRDVYEDFRKLTVDIVGNCAFGFEFKALTMDPNATSKLAEATDEMMAASSNPLILVPGAMNLPIPAIKRFKRSSIVMNELAYSVVQHRRKLIKEDPNREFNDILDLMLQPDAEGNQVLNDRQVRDNAFTFLLAGHETTTSAMSACLFELARHPDIQQKVREEALQMFSKSEVPQMEDMEAAPFLSAVVNESLRCYPPAPGLVREVSEEGIKIGGFSVPKGTMVLIPLHAMQIHEEFWGKEPNKWKPERWLASNEERPKMTFAPFGFGGHACIGKLFALNEFKMTMCYLLRQFEFVQIQQDLLLSKGRSMRFQSGCNVKIVRRSV